MTNEAMTKIFANPSALLDAAGTKLGPTDWIRIDQKRIDDFAQATGDHQWIHVDPVRARQGPFGTTIAHGYLTLSLASLFLPKLMRVEACAMGVNYGLDKVRFPTHVPVEALVRAHGEVVSAARVAGGVQIVVRVTIERESSDKPACVADTISRFMELDPVKAT